MALLGGYKGTGAGLVDRLIRMELLDDASEIVSGAKQESGFRQSPWSSTHCSGSLRRSSR